MAREKIINKLSDFLYDLKESFVNRFTNLIGQIIALFEGDNELVILNKYKAEMEVQNGDR